MRRSSLLVLVPAGAFLLAQFSGLAVAQAPGGGAGATTPSTSQSPRAGPDQTPGANGPAGPGATDNASPARMDDKKFVKDAALGGMAEVELGKLAVQKASRDDVKQFGQKMVDDHSKANDQLKEVAGKENITIPDVLDTKHQAKIDKMSKLTGADFDKAYVKHMLKDHESDVREFQSEAQSGSDPGVKAFASSTLPTLQQHLEMVKSLNKSQKSAGK